MLASLLVNEPFGLFAGDRPKDNIRPRKLRRTNIPDGVIVKGFDAIRDYIAEQAQKDAEREFKEVTTGRHTPKPKRVVPLTVAEAIADIRAEAIEIDNELALIFILASLD